MSRYNIRPGYTHVMVASESPTQSPVNDTFLHLNIDTGTLYVWTDSGWVTVTSSPASIFSEGSGPPSAAPTGSVRFYVDTDASNLYVWIAPTWWAFAKGSSVTP